MRFVHAADIHLDSPLAGMTRRDPALARLTATCTRDAFSRLVDETIAHDADLLLIAGDLYDAEQRNFELGLFFAAEMRRLARPVVMIHGNHDSASPITKALQPPANVTILRGRAPETVTLPGLGVAVHGQSFAARAETHDMAARYPAPIAGAFNIGLLHSSVESPGEHATYAPCAVSTLLNKDYGYWALGHVHTRQDLHDDPRIHFPGNPQGRHVRETGARGATLVEVEDGRVRGSAFLPTDVLRWAVLALDLTSVDTTEHLAALLHFQLAALRLDAAGRPAIIRIELEGATPLHAALLSNPAVIDALCRDAAAQAGDDMHVERVKLRTRPREDGGTDLAALEQAVRTALADPAVAATLLRDFERLQAAIPVGAEVDVPRTAGALAALHDDAWSVIRHALTGAAPERDVP